MNPMRRQLGVLGAAALSLAIMAPTAAMALNGSLAASIAGTAVPLSFVLALVTIALVAYAFIEFARQYATAGSVYTFNGVALGARTGFLSGWALLFTYLAFAAASAAETGAFFQSFVGLLGVHIWWVWPALVTAVLVWVLGTRDISLSTRTTLVIEGLSILAIVVLAIVIVAHGGDSGLTAQPFAIGSGGLSKVGLASVFAFLSFAGFEGAATLGEETADPKRSIPRAIAAAVFAAGIFYVVISYVQSVRRNPHGRRDHGRCHGLGLRLHPGRRHRGGPHAAHTGSGRAAALLAVPRGRAERLADDGDQRGRRRHRRRRAGLRVRRQ
jgi:amino acid transporter